MSNRKEAVTVRWLPSSEGGSETFTPEDLGVESMEEFWSLSEDDQRELLNQAMHDADTRGGICYPQVTKWLRSGKFNS